jgi:hypothetical protein
MCDHRSFSASVIVNRFGNDEKYIVEVQAHCNDCEMPLKFLGLPMGLDMNGAAVSVDRQEARLAAEVGGTILK